MSEPQLTTASESSNAQFNVELTGIRDEVSDLSTSIASLEAADTNLENSISAVETDVSSLTTSLGTLSGTVSGHTTDLGGLATDLSALETSLGGTQASVSTLTTDLNAAEANVEELQGDVIQIVSSFGIGMRGIKVAHDSEDNAIAFNDYFGGGWISKTGIFDIAGTRIPISQTLQIPAIEGFAFRTTGLGFPKAESQYGSSNTTANKIGGMPSGFVWDDPDNISGAIMNMAGAGGHIGCLNLYGNKHPTSLAALIADTTHRKEFGLTIEGQQSGVGPVKLEGSLSTYFCQTGVKILATPLEANGDESRLFTFRPHYNDVGIHFANSDAVGWVIDYLDHGTTPVGVLMERGKDLDLGVLLGQSFSTIGVSVTGNDTVTGGAITIRRAQVDAQAPSTYRIVNVNPTSGSNGLDIILHYLRGQSARASGEYYFDLTNYYGALQVLGGMHLVERTFRVIRDSSSFPCTIIIQNCRFQRGTDLFTTAVRNVRKLFTADSRGYINVLFDGCREIDGFTGASNGGRFWAPYLGQIRITGDGDSDYTEILP